MYKESKNIVFIMLLGFLWLSPFENVADMDINEEKTKQISLYIDEIKLISIFRDILLKCNMIWQTDFDVYNICKDLTCL